VRRAAWAFFVFAALAADSRRIRLNDLPEAVRPALEGHARSVEAFDRFVAQTAAESERRLREGELDHLVFFVLQSRVFSSLPPIEPAASARENPERPPPEVLKRIDAFLGAKSVPEQRFTEMRKLLESEAGDPRQVLVREYLRSMRFLYEKEHLSRQKEGEQQRRHVAELYRSRGHSTDTAVEANFAAHVGLSLLKEQRPRLRLSRVLVIGPGLDFAPRTALRDDHPPQSPQPYALMDSLLRLGLAGDNELDVHCVDLNPRVTRFFADFAAGRERTLVLAWQPAEAEHREFFAGLGNRIGTSLSWAHGRKIAVRPELARRVTASRLDIVTETLATAEPFDLAVATNVLLYFNDAELALAFANIRSMLKPGGYLLHNETRAETDSIARLLAMPVVHARMVRLARVDSRELHDACILHQVLPVSK
jgi:SAM-dependent methyltransferase